MGTVLLLTLLPFIVGLGIGLAAGLRFSPVQPRDARGRFVKVK